MENTQFRRDGIYYFKIEENYTLVVINGEFTKCIEHRSYKSYDYVLTLGIISEYEFNQAFNEVKEKLKQFI